MGHDSGWRFVGSAVRNWFVAIYFAATIATVSAEPEPPPGSGPLPDPLKGARVGAIVNASHSQLYRKLLPPELAELLDVGEFQFEAMLQPREPGRWVQPKSNTSGDVEVTSSGGLRGVPAGGLQASMFEVPSVPQGDLKQLAYKVLWNVTGAIAQTKSLALRLKVGIFQRPEVAPHWLEFFVERVYPLALGQSPGTEKPLFREKIAAAKPQAIEKLSWLTLRFFGPGEDFVWAASPMINSIRQMTGSNRSDAIFERIFAPDDLFVWSGKNELVETAEISTRPLLVPIIEASHAPSDKQEQCLVTSFTKASDIQSNSDSNRFVGAGAWVPTNSLMVLRNVWVIELSSRDPFTNDVHQTLYIDIDSGLPVYKIVREQAGKVTKVVIGLLRSVQDGAHGAHAMWAGEYIIYPEDGARTAVLVQEATRCESFVKGRELINFDPSSFVVFDSSARKPGEKEKTLEEPSKAEDISD